MDAVRDVVAWKVAFYGDPKGWERLLIRPGFRHCSAFGWAKAGFWIEIDANLSRIETRILTHEGYVERLVALNLKNARIIDVDVRQGEGLRWSPTCAGVIAGLLGVKGALRPHGLFRDLSRQAS